MIYIEFTGDYTKRDTPKGYPARRFYFFVKEDKDDECFEATLRRRFYALLQLLKECYSEHIVFCDSLINPPYQIAFDLRPPKYEQEIERKHLPFLNDGRIAM